MRIVGNIDHPVMKITVFHANNRYSVKFETGLYEQTYKFRDSDDIHSLEDIQLLLDDPFMSQVLHEFTQMHRIKNDAMERAYPAEEDGSGPDEII